VGLAHLTLNPTHYMHGPMPSSAVIKDPDFQLISEFAQPDAKKRLSLGEALGGATAFNIYRNPLGQIVLDPVKAVPAGEMWLYENPQALASIKQGQGSRRKGKAFIAAHSPSMPRNRRAAKNYVHANRG
jgi:hypothetical protein